MVDNPGAPPTADATGNVVAGSVVMSVAATRSRILEAALDLFGSRGVEAVSLDEIARTVGVRKQSLLYWFASKDDLAVAAADHWSETTGALFAAAPYHDHDDPADRVFGYLDFRASLISGVPADYTCLVGTMTQEAFDTSPAVRDACAASIFGHAETLEPRPHYPAAPQWRAT